MPNTNIFLAKCQQSKNDFNDEQMIEPTKQQFR